MRALRRTLILLLVLAALFVGADRLAVKFAEDMAAEKVADAQSAASPEKTEVDIHGFPFLTQLAGKELDEVEVGMSGMRAGAGSGAGDRNLTVTHVDATLRHVRIEGAFSSAVAEQATGTARISYADLSEAADEGITIGWGGRNDKGEGQVKVTGKLSFLGRSVEGNVLSTVDVEGGDTVKLHAEDVPGAGIPGVEQAVRQKIDLERRAAGLPAGLKLEKVTATEKGVELSLTGKDVALG